MKEPIIYNIRQRSLDTNYLMTQLIQFQQDNDKYPYLFMSRETIDALSDNKYLLCKETLDTSNGIISKYKGYRIFEDPTKKYGEVELR